MAKLRNMGEACTSANRLYVQSGVVEEFSRRMAARMEQLRLGRGVDPDTDVGPLIDETQRSKVHELVTDAVERGATVLTGGGPLDGPGYFYRPTVLTDVPDASRVLAEEIFGPVAPIVSFETEEEAVAKANASEYGLMGYVFTRDLNRAPARRARRSTPAWSASTRACRQTRGAVRRRQAVGVRARGRRRGDRGVPVAEVCGDRGVGG